MTTGVTPASSVAGAAGIDLPNGVRRGEIRSTSFVGRRRQMSEIRAALGASRLVSPTGPGGVGKTRLAVEMAREVGRLYRDGVALVELDSISDDAEVPAAIVHALGISDQSARDPVQKVIDHLYAREMLLVLDNCEHVLEGSTAITDAILRSSSRVHIMATSRISLGITEERLCCVPHLTIPPDDEHHSAASVAQYESVRLLTERAAAAAPEFRLDDATAADAAQLCIRLEGSPLAIELAVARLRTLTLSELVARLSDRFALLSKGSRCAAPRQQTLRAMIDWSYALCTPSQRRLWARLSVFAGGFDLTAAEGVCAGVVSDEAKSDDAVPSESGMVDLLGELIDQSLLYVDTTGPTRRFRMLETIREYGAERLALLGEAQEIARRHCRYYLELTEAITENWCGPDQRVAVESLRDERSNVRAAMDWCTARHDYETALKIFSALRFRWYADGHIAEGRRRADELLDNAASDDVAPHIRANALWVATWVCLLQGEQRAADRRLGECARLACELDDPLTDGYVHKLRGLTALFTGELDLAIDNYRVATTALRDCREWAGYLSASFQYALALALVGRSEECRAVTDDALAVCAEHDERWDRSYIQWVRALDHWLCGDLESAQTLGREAVALHVIFNHSVGTALMTELLAWIAQSAGDPDRSAELLGAAGALWDRSGTSIAAFGPDLSERHARCEIGVRTELSPSRLRDHLRMFADRSHAELVERVLGDTRVLGEDGRTSVSVPLGGCCPLCGDECAEDAHDSPPAQSVAGQPLDNPLTSRQTEIAAMVARSMSNKQIAERLVVSVRTVESHVERALVRLGFHTRTELASWYIAAHTSA